MKVHMDVYVDVVAAIRKCLLGRTESERKAILFAVVQSIDEMPLGQAEGEEG